jgi:hypothetical protein
MTRKQLVIGLVVVALVALAGCNDVQTGDEQSDQLASDTNMNISGVNPGASYWYEVRVTEKNQMGLVEKRSPFIMEDSLERQNLIRRYQYLNDQNNVHHVYLMSNDGKVISYFVAQGKVSSVNSKLTNDKQIVVDKRCIETTHRDNEAGCFKAVESPQMDGSYGSNGAAIFFFTTSGEYVEWNGKYVVSEKPLNIQTSISLEHDVGNETGS